MAGVYPRARRGEASPLKKRCRGLGGLTDRKTQFLPGEIRQEAGIILKVCALNPVYEAGDGSSPLPVCVTFLAPRSFFDAVLRF